MNVQNLQRLKVDAAPAAEGELTSYAKELTSYAAEQADTTSHAVAEAEAELTSYTI